MFRSRRQAALRRRLCRGSEDLMRLTEQQFALLAAAIEGGPGARAPCAPASRVALVAACRAWRWPDLRDPADLRRLPFCLPPENPESDCCNPYHWSKLCKPESPPPPYCRFAMDDKLKPEDRAPSEEDCRRTDHERLAPASLTTDGEEKLAWEREWCRLAYWELARRVGRQYGVRVATVDVFGGGAEAAGPLDGLCLDTLACGNTFPQIQQLPPSQRHLDSVSRTRAKIGLGVTLSLEPDGVWLYNRSELPIFVNSPTLDDPDARVLPVYRVPPGHCLCIFDPEKAANTTPPRSHAGPVDPNSVRISFAKGWGPKYSRQDVTACPCWLEVLLAPCR